MINQYSIREKGREYKVSEHFKLGEFACKDGSNTVLISTELLTMLERLRAYVGGSINIMSGYRTAAYNKKIGGASASQHVKGTAADIAVYRSDGSPISAKIICCICQTMGFKGIGFISAYSTHVDMRTAGSYRGDERKDYSGNVGGDFYKYFGISGADILRLKKEWDQTSTASEQVPAPQTKIEKEEEEMIYKTIAEVPEWGRAAVQLRIDHGWSDGKNLQDSLVRAWVAQDREDPYIANVEDVPRWAQAEVSALLDSGKLKGTGVETIGMRLSTLRAVIIAAR